MTYPAVGPELAFLKEEGRIEASTVTDRQALTVFEWMRENADFTPSLEASHAIHQAIEITKKLSWR